MILGLYSSYKRSSMPQENHHLCQRKCTPMKYYFCLSNAKYSKCFVISASFTLGGLHTGERKLPRQMLILQQLLLKIFCRKMVLQSSMYVSTSTFVLFENHILNNLLGLGFLIFRWHMVELTLDFIMEPILV